MIRPASDILPGELDGAQVLKTAQVIGVAITPTGNTRHLVGDRELAPASRLAIAQYPGEVGFYLFHCDGSWKVLADTWHETVADAEAQAEFEYAGISAAWRSADGT